jgi:hypothetical protein
LSTDILKTNLLHANGKRMVMLGGDVYEQKTTGDITHEYKWVDGEPVMLLYKRILGSNTPAYMIEMKDAHEFMMSNGYASKRLISTLCYDAAKVLRAENDKATLFRIIGIIEEGIAILLRMPPEPKAIEVANRPTTGNDEISIKVDGKVIFEAQL